MRSPAGFEVDGIGIGFVVNLTTLRDVLRCLSIDGRRWWIACDPVDALETSKLTIGHGDPHCTDRLNTLYFNVPILNYKNSIAGTDTLLLLLDSAAISAVEPGLYLENGQVMEDGFIDLECFFQPIRTALIDKLRQE